MKKIAYIVILLSLVAFPVLAETNEADTFTPKFAALASNKVNMRTGPGLRYPIDWVLLKEDAPVQITNSFGHWRKIKDVNGDEGWVHQAMVSGRRTAWVQEALTPLRSEPEENSQVIAQAGEGVIAKVEACPKGNWCRVTVGAYEGWLTRSAIWGIERGEVIE